MTKGILTASILAGGAAFGAATVTDWSQDPNTSLVTVNYTLADEAAVVTLDVLTNGVSIGADNISRVAGDANRVIQPSDATRTITWRPDYSWEGHLFTNGEITVRAVAWPLDDPPPYMAVNLATVDQDGESSAWVRYYAGEGALPGGIGSDLWRGEWLLLRRIPAGGREFVMGSPTTEPFHVSAFNGRTYDPWENGTDGQRNPLKTCWALPETLHAVAFTKDFYMGVFPITCAQFDYICNSWKDYGESSALGTAYKRWKSPVQGLTWNTARGEGTWPGQEPAETSTLGKLRAMTGLDFDLPTEAQWEFACRAGTTTSLNSGKEISSSQYASGAGDASAKVMREVMWSWCYTTPEKQAVSMIGDANNGIPVGLLKPNNWGLYDMHGNVGEWCLDWVDKNVFSTEPTIDPSGCADGGELGCKAIRGGATAQWSLQCRSATRMGLAPTYSSWATGMRVICPAKAVK